eukprot:PITA_22206
MDQAKEQIKRAYKDKVAKYGPIWEIIDERWNNKLHRPIHAARYFLNPQYHYKAKETGALRGEVRDGLIDCIDRMIPLECDQLEIHRQVTTFTNASGTFGKNLAKIAREADEPVLLGMSAIGPSLHTKKRNHLDQKRLNDLVYVQYNLRLRCNQLLNKRPDSNPLVVEDIDPTSDWLNVYPDPLVPASTSQRSSPPVAGASSAQRQHKSISRLSQLASIAQPASATTFTIAVGDDDEKEPWGTLSDSDDDPEIDPHDLGSSGSSY